MLQRGRKPKARTAQTPGTRPSPPDYLTKEQAEVWKSTVDNKPSDWFTKDTFPILAQFCRHVVSQNLIAARINEIEPDILKDKDMFVAYGTLLRFRKAETVSLISLANTMRVSQSAMTAAKTTHPSPTAGTDAGKPWEAPPEDDD